MVPKEHWKKVVEEVEEFCRVMRGEGVEVKRPEIVDWTQTFKTPYFESKGKFWISKCSKCSNGPILAVKI